jgi:phage minor structural protein
LDRQRDKGRNFTKLEVGIVRIYAPTSTPAQLATNGIGNLLCESATVHEEINGEFSLTLEVAQASEHLDDVIIGAIVKADTPRGPQFFRLSTPITTLDGGKEVFAWHISYDLAQDMILNRAWTGKTGTEALPDILQAGISETRFTGTSDISLVTNMRIVRTSVLGAIIEDQDNSFVNRWGGEIERDNFTVNVKEMLGANKGVTIEYRKNLTGLIIEEDDNEVANRIIPSGLDGNDTVIMLPEVYIDSDLIGETPIPHVRHIHFSDVKVGKKDEDGNVLYEDADDVKDKLRELVAEMYEQGVDLPLKSATVEFVELSQTEEYKDFVILETVEIGDTVKCKYKTTMLSRRVVSYDYASLTKKYINIVLGNVVPKLGDTLWAQDLDMSALSNTVSGKLTEGEIYYGVEINHEKGILATAEIGGKTVEVRMNSGDGFAFYVDDVYMGGTKLINGEVGFVGNILTNNPNGNCYAVIGEYTSGGETHHGIFVYDKAISASAPVFRITAYGDTDAYGISVSDRNNIERVVLDGEGSTYLRDTYGDMRIVATEDESYLEYLGNLIGVDSGGAYYENSGSERVHF